MKSSDKDCASSGCFRLLLNDPPHTVNDILRKLSSQVPLFVERILSQER